LKTFLLSSLFWSWSPVTLDITGLPERDVIAYILEVAEKRIDSWVLCPEGDDVQVPCPVYGMTPFWRVGVTMNTGSVDFLPEPTGLGHVVYGRVKAQDAQGNMSP
jgi:hypothetical protein